MKSCNPWNILDTLYPCVFFQMLDFTLAVFFQLFHFFSSSLGFSSDFGAQESPEELCVVLAFNILVSPSKGKTNFSFHQIILSRLDRPRHCKRNVLISLVLFHLLDPGANKVCCVACVDVTHLTHLHLKHGNLKSAIILLPRSKFDNQHQSLTLNHCN